MAPAGPAPHGLPTGPSGQRSSIGSMMGGTMTHHHAQPDGSPKMEQVSGMFQPL